MRDINRIDKVLGEIKCIWEKYPDLRLTQLIMNLSNSPLLYYMEDDELVRALKVLYGENDEKEEKNEE